jgi:hypothetical protein
VEVVRAPPEPRIVMRVVGWRGVGSWEREEEILLVVVVRAVGSEAEETLLSTLVTVLRSIVSRRSSSLGSVGLLWAKTWWCSQRRLWLSRTKRQALFHELQAFVVELVADLDEVRAPGVFVDFVQGVHLPRSGGF